MQELLQVNDKGELQEDVKPVSSYPLYFKIPATVISYLFHPVFIIGLMAWYIIYQHPTAYLGMDEKLKTWRLLIACVNGIFFPLVSALLLKGLGFISSMLSPSRKDRIVLYIVSMIFFFWTFWIFRNFKDSPRIIKAMTLGVFLSAPVALIFNNYHKISMHAIGVGGLVAMVLLSIYTDANVISALPLTIALLIAGLVCTSRLIISGHTPFDIYVGFIMGMLCQVIGWIFST